MKKSIKRLQEYGKLCAPTGGEIFFRRAASIKKRLEVLGAVGGKEVLQKINTYDCYDPILLYQLALSDYIIN